MRVRVDEAGSDHEIGHVQLALGVRGREVADGGDHAGFDADVTGVRGATRPVDDRPSAQDQVERHDCLLVSAVGWTPPAPQGDLRRPLIGWHASVEITAPEELDVDVAAAADLLAAHRLGRRAFDGFPADLRPTDEDQGYLIQYALHERLTAAGRGALAGYKIGCTTPVMQAYLGIHNPCSGGIFAPTVQAHDDLRATRGRLRTGVECELAVRLGRDLPAASAPFTMQRRPDWPSPAPWQPSRSSRIATGTTRRWPLPHSSRTISSEPVACSARSGATGARSISRRSRRAC